MASSCVKRLFYIGVIVVLLGIGFNNILKPGPVPTLEEKWWGPGNSSKQDKSIRDFKINISDNELKDLKYRLDHHRSFVPPLEGIQQQYGMNTNLLKEVVDFWRTKYSWREREKYLNKFPQYITNIQGLDIHFIRVKPTKTKGVTVLPLLILHGWPGSLREFMEIIPILTTPKDGIVFEVIAPHIPGYGFSQAAVRPGLGAAQIAVVMKNLMQRLGFNQFYAQGGDFGAIILQHLSVLFPENVLGFHSNMCTVHTTRSFIYTVLASIYPSWIVREDHADRVYPMKTKFQETLRETGYFHLQATKPDTIGVGLNDSPVGLAAYILEKFVTGTNITYQQLEDGGLKNWYAYIELLDNIMIYWWTKSATTSFRLYSETFNKAHSGLGIMGMPIQVPSACARFKNDFYTADGLLEEIHPNLLQLTDHHGGHFAALQLPNVLAEDLFSAVLKFEKFNKESKNKE